MSVFKIGRFESEERIATSSLVWSLYYRNVEQLPVSRVSRLL